MVKRKPNYISRLEEAQALIEDGHYRNAVESASGGIEFLMQALWTELRDELIKKDYEHQKYLKGKYDEFTKTRNQHRELTLGQWITFYCEIDVFDELVAAFSYRFSQFNKANLYTINNIRNKCVHKNYEPTGDEARLFCNHLAAFLQETRREPQKEKGKPTVIESMAEDWWQKWSATIEEWLQHNSDSQEAALVSTLIDQLMLVAALIGDKAVPQEVKPALMTALNYVIRPVDLISEADEGVHGLIDDATVLTFTLYWIISNKRISAAALRKYWVGSEDPDKAIEQLYASITANHSTLFSDEIWTRIRPIAIGGPEELWKNQLGAQAQSENMPENIYQRITQVQDADNWYEKWRQKIHERFEKPDGSAVADTIFVLPDLFMLITRLLQDSRISASVKARLLAVTAYAINPFDLIPEALVGVLGLTDDVTALGLIGYWLITIVKVEREILDEHWPGDSNPIEKIESLHQQIMENANAIFGEKTGVFASLRERFALESKADNPGRFERVRRLFRRDQA